MKRAYKETRTFTIGGREQDYTVGAIFEVDGHEVEFTPCTAIATCADETERSSAIFVHDTTEGKLEGPGGMWDKEDLDNPDFMEVAQEMADELNDYIEEEEEC